MTTIRIEVSGPANSGKSGVIQVIQQALNEAGLSATILAPKHGPHDNERLQKVLASIAEHKTEIVILEGQSSFSGVAL